MQTIELMYGDTCLSTKDPVLALHVLSQLTPTANLSFGAEPQTGIQTIPALGEYWPGQGGYNAGLVAARGDVPEHYLIVAKEDIGKHSWGGYREESEATSKTDGYKNTETLCNEGRDHPAANACAVYVADGFNDFYLPACAELYHCWLNVPDLFAKDTYYWSSTQRSAYYAFTMYFDGGIQLNNVKYNELRVRPVRRLFI